jgi:NAD(P)H dehydrogenase (quinone)
MSRTIRRSGLNFTAAINNLSQGAISMNVGIFIHSQSGNTSSMGMAITMNLRAQGNEVDIQLMKTAGRLKPRMKHVEFRDDSPNMAPYDVVIFGGPIWGFTVSPVVGAFIKEIPELKGKKALCFSTSGFPTAISGARGGLKKMEMLLDGLGATVLESEPFFWGLFRSKKKMDNAVNRICDRICKSGECGKDAIV